MKAAFHYIVRANIIRNGNEIGFENFEENFENENPIIARGQAFNYYQNIIDVLLEGKK